MRQKENHLMLSAICALFLLLSIWGIVWDFTSGTLTSGVDGIMLLFVCLMMAGVFGLMLLFEFHKAGILPLPGSKSKAAGAPPGK
jgi:hypothetical protein